MFVDKERKLILKERLLKKNIIDYANTKKNINLQTVNIENQRYGIFSNGIF